MVFNKPLGPMKAADVKKILAPLLDFEKHSATELYVDNLPPEIQQAIKAKRPKEGMDREQVILAMGRPVLKSSEPKDGLKLADWIYGNSPGGITSVTFNGNKVFTVKGSSAGLGAEAAAPRPAPYRSR